MTVTVEAEATEQAEATENENTEGGKRGRKAEPRDFSVWREDHESFANYINERHPEVAINPAQVKAVFLLRGDWTNTPERIAEREKAAKLTEQEKAQREAKKAERAAAKALEAQLTPEQKEARKERSKAVKAAERAAKRAAELQAKAEKLAAEAGMLDDAAPATEVDPTPAEAELTEALDPAPEVVEADEVVETGDDEVGEAPATPAPVRKRKRPAQG